MRYWKPSTEETLDAIEKDGVGKVILLPLYPQFSKATTTSSVKEWEKQLKLRGKQIETTLVESYYDFDPYIQNAYPADKRGPATFPDRASRRCSFGLHAHGTPMKVVREGDPYSGHIKKTLEAVMRQGEYQKRAQPLLPIEGRPDEVVDAVNA